ncbi:conserved hypothetical protein [Ricinus communis]|uniref:Uncharacterized protein n=1 Tax=Ricinus communis TaxID=3988 RepID=B9S4N5_RICCO|nr:conserved hypothetical protein [Ricinus communis]
MIVIDRLDSFASSTIDFVPRAGNSPADWLARNVAQGNLNPSWVSNPPDQLCALLSADPNASSDV